MKRNFCTIFLLILGILLFSYTSGLKAEEHLPTGYRVADIKNGGLLYDNWLRMKGIEIKNSHALFPLKAKKRGVTTWRCKECHGWDYQGKEGRYNEDFYYYVGFKGVYDVKDMPPEKLFFAIADIDENHDFTKYLRLSVSDVWSLVKFIREGLVDIKTVINPDGTVNGDPLQGKSLYLSYCADCHGYHGNYIEFKEEVEGIHGIGWEANADPQETLHKIRWGHPGSEMPSAIVDHDLSDQDTVDILSYCQTLFP
jgi:thiosulfate dehydrogenase